MPVAVHKKMDNFTNHEIELNKGDLLYMFTDGYPDQFGGPRRKKFKYKPFKRLLVENSTKPMTDQKEALETALDSWMNFDGNNYEQIDDITILGLKI